MRILAIGAQDLSSISCGLLEGNEWLAEETIVVPPERFLQAVDGFLKKNFATIKTIERVVVVTGPGSFTSARLSTIIANTIGFVHNIPIVGLQNTGRLPFHELLTHHDIVHLSARSFVFPIYDRAAHITAPSCQ